MKQSQLCSCPPARLTCTSIIAWGILFWFLTSGETTAAGQDEQENPAAVNALETRRRRVLADGDAQLAMNLQKQTDEFRLAGNNVEALKPARELYDLHARLQGPDHWQTADARRLITTLERTLTFPRKSQVELAEAMRMERESLEVYDRGKYAEAIVLLERVLKIRRAHLGNAHIEVADAMGNLGHCLTEEDRLEEAEPLLRQSMRIYGKTVGTDHPKTARSYNWLAANLNSLGETDEAKVLLRESLRINLELRGEQHPDTAETYTVMGFSFYFEGDYPEAEKLIRKALAIRQEVFGENHADTAQSHSDVGFLLGEQGKFQDAELEHRKALDIRREFIGEEHPDTAQSYNNLGMTLCEQAKYDEADSALRTALRISRSVLGENATTALYYNNVGYNIEKQGRYLEAEPLHRKALEIRERLLGRVHRQTAQSYNNLAANLVKQGRFQESEPLFRNAMNAFEKVFGEQHPTSATVYFNAAMVLHNQAKYVTAEPVCRRVLEVFRRVLGEEHPNTAAAYRFLGMNLNGQGEYAQAEPLLRRALQISLETQGPKHPGTADSYNLLGWNLSDQGKYADAEVQYRKALEIRESTSGSVHSGTAAIYLNMGRCQEDQRQPAAGEPWIRRAVDVYLETLGPNHHETALAFDNLAANLIKQDKYTEAKPLLQKAIDIRLRVFGRQHPYTVLSYNKMAACLHAEGDYARAESMLTDAAKSFVAARQLVNFRGLGRVEFDMKYSPLLQLAAVLARNGKPSEAWERLEQRLGRGLYDDLMLRNSRQWTLQERARHQELLSKARQMQATIQAIQTGSIPQETLSKIRRQRETLLAEASQLESELMNRYEGAAGEVCDRHTVQQHLARNAAFLAWLDLESSGETWACLLRCRGEPVWLRLPGSGPDGAWTESDRELPGRIRALCASRPSDQTSNWSNLASRLSAQRLEPLEPYLNATDELPAVRHLIVLPSSGMAGIPIEVLTQEQLVSYAPSATMFIWLKNRYQRATRPGPSIERGNLLAVGDPVFRREAHQTVDPELDHGAVVTTVLPGSNAARNGLMPGDVILTYGGAKVLNASSIGSAIAARLAREEPSDPESMTQASNSRPQIPVSVWRDDGNIEIMVSPGKLGVTLNEASPAEVIMKARKIDEMISPSRGVAYSDLPATRAEVKTVSGLFERSLALLGSEASEQNLHQLLNDGRLKQFQVLHFATHGQMNPELPMQSALMLADDDLPDGVAQYLAGKKVYDGRLSAEEILESWELDADLVTLSACQTALGKEAGGEGYVGFSQAIFLAGGRSCVLSLWKVDDSATSLFMTRFYQNLLGKRKGLAQPMPKCEALHEAKRWLRRLTAEEVGTLVARLPEVARGKERSRETTVRSESAHPFAHPYFWSSFILIGEPY